MTAYSPENQLWANVLLNAINDAEAPNAPKEHLDYVTKPNSGCNDVCRLAGIDPAAFYTRMRDKFGLKPLSHSAPKIDLTTVRLPRMSKPKSIAVSPPPKPAKAKCNRKTAPRPKAAPRPETLYTFDGRSMPLAKWAQHLGISEVTLSARLKHGWTVEQTLTRPRGWRSENEELGGDLYSFKGRTQTLKQWSEETGLSVNALQQRERNGWSLEEMFTIPAKHWRPVKKEQKAQVVRKPSQSYTYDNRTLTLAEWSKETGIGVMTLRGRLRSGWTLAKALTDPINAPENRPRKPCKLFTYNGRTLSLEDWSQVTGIPRRILWSRIYKGWPIERALEQPHRPQNRAKTDEVQP